jgi:biotin carboxyl carrier protein
MEEQSETIINNDDLFRILKLMEESQWDEIEIVTKNFKFKVGKNLPSDYNSTLSPSFSQPLLREDKPHPIIDSKPDTAEVSSRNQTKAKSSDIPKVNTEVNGKTIYAPMMGMFYRAPSPGAALS